MHQKSGMEFVAHEELKQNPRRKCKKIEWETLSDDIVVTISNVLFKEKVNNKLNSRESNVFH